MSNHTPEPWSLKEKVINMNDPTPDSKPQISTEHIINSLRESGKYIAADRLAAQEEEKRELRRELVFKNAELRAQKVMLTYLKLHQSFLLLLEVLDCLEGFFITIKPFCRYF